MFSLLVLVFIALFTRSEGNAEVIRTSQIINHEIGGSQIIFNLAELGDVALYQFKCVVRFHDGRDSIEKEPIIPRDRLSAICRLPSGISGTIVDIDLTISLPTVYTSIPFARYVTPTYTEVLSQTLFVDPSPLDKIKVTENWNANQLTLTWDTTYFEQFFNPGVKITLLLFVHFGKGFEPDEFGANIMASVVQNLGTTTVTLPAQTIAQLANVLHPYFYVLRPLATLSTDIFLTSLLFAPTLGMNEYAAQQTCSDWLRSAQVPAAKEIYPCPPCLCQVKLDTNFVEAEYPPQIVELANGTLNDHVLYYEAVPSQSGYAQTCSYSLLTKNLATTSPAQAGWIHYLSKQISYEYNYFYDVWPYMVCCLQSNSQEYCDLFHEKRPIDTGHVYKAEKPSSGCGDPHMTTFESVKYDFMGYGEFWLIRGPEGSDFGVQGRMSPVWANQKVSYYKAIAARDGNTTVQIELRDGKLITILNGKELQFTKLPVSLPMKSVYLLINSTRVDIRFQSGFSIIVLDNKGLFVDVYSRAAEHNRGKGFMGIFGNFDDNRDNDLTSQDGLVIPPTSQNLRDLSLLHHRFGMTWLTKRTESFFVYEQGKSWDDYVNVDFGPIAQYPDPATLPEEVRAICGDSLFCYYEYVGTGDLELAAETVVKEKESDEIRKEMEEKVPMCDTLNQPANGKVQVNGYLNGSLATYSCNKEYDFESGDRVRTCSSSKGQPQWTGSQPACIWTCKACLETTVFEFSHDPSDCSQFFLCYFGERILSYCPIGTYFDPKTLDCSANYKCIGAPGC